MHPPVETSVAPADAGQVGRVFDAYAPSYNKSMDELQYSVPKRVEEWSRQARASASSSAASSSQFTSSPAPVADDKVCAVHSRPVLVFTCNPEEISLQQCAQSNCTFSIYYCTGKGACYRLKRIRCGTCLGGCGMYAITRRMNEPCWLSPCLSPLAFSFAYARECVRAYVCLWLYLCACVRALYPPYSSSSSILFNTRIPICCHADATTG